MQRIDEVMTPQPWTVQLEDSVGVVRQMFSERAIHHLPVLSNGELIGIAHHHDLPFAPDPCGTIADVVRPIHRVAPETPLVTVLDDMTEHHWDAVVVTDEQTGNVQGVFTSSDAVRLLRDRLDGCL